MNTKFSALKNSMADSKENYSRSWGWKDQSFYVFVVIENNEALSGLKNKRFL